MRSVGGVPPLLVVMLGALVGCGSASKLPPGALASSTVAPLCGPAGDWSASTLADAALPADAMPSPFATTRGGAMSPDNLSGSELVAAYHREWAAGTNGSAAIELYAFHNETDAGAYLASRSDSGNPSAVIPGATEYTHSTAAGDIYNVVAERAKVVMHLAIGGPGVTQTTMESLASRQYDRLCQH